MAVAGYLIVIASGYLLGSIMFAVIISRRFAGIDIYSVGSGNPGFTNVYRTAGSTPGLLTLLGDMGKGGAAVALGRWVLPLGFPVDGPTMGLVAAGAAVLGHALPLFFGFRGGKGVAAAAGGFLCLAPAALGFALLVWALTLAVVRYVSVASIAGASAFAIYVTFIARPADGSISLVVVSWVLAAAIVLRHRSNLSRLRRGEEGQFTLKRS